MIIVGGNVNEILQTCYRLYDWLSHCPLTPYRSTTKTSCLIRSWVKWLWTQLFQTWRRITHSIYRAKAAATTVTSQACSVWASSPAMSSPLSENSQVSWNRNELHLCVDLSYMWSFGNVESTFFCQCSLHIVYFYQTFLTTFVCGGALHI